MLIVIQPLIAVCYFHIFYVYTFVYSIFLSIFIKNKTSLAVVH